MTQPQEPLEDFEADETSIDDALEAGRVAGEDPGSRHADGYGLDADLARGGDDSAASEQGNRDEDRMEADVPEELPEL